MLECQNCGATGDSFFSQNYFGEMVCELCGTQSFLQARNETQDVEDMGMDFVTVVKTLKRRTVRKKKRDADGNVIEEPRRKRPKKEKKARENPKLPPLLDCVVATQMVLDAMARALVERVGAHVFPADEYPNAVKELWFKFLHTWGVKGSKPLLRCYNEFFLHMTKEEAEKVDPAVTLDLLEQWDAEWEKKKGEEEDDGDEEEAKGQDDDDDDDEDEEEEEEEEEDDDEEEEEGEDEEEGKKGRGKKKKNKKKNNKKANKKKKKKQKNAGVEIDGESKPKRKYGGYKSKRDRRQDLLANFTTVDLLGILMLASRVLNLGVLPSDFSDWVKTGVIPFHNALATCCADAPDVRDSVKFISLFFQSLMGRHKAEATHIAYSARNLQYHMGLRLPPLNVPLAAHRICAAMGFPAEVFRHFQWITGFINVTGNQPEPPLLLQYEPMSRPRLSRPTEEDKARVHEIIHSEIGIAAHLVVAVKMCANWHEWIYERQHDEEEEEEKGDGDDDEETKRKAPPLASIHQAWAIPRRDLKAFTQFARQAFVDPDRPGIPEELEEHVGHLRNIERTDELSTPEQGKLKQSSIYAYPAIHVDGVLAESDEAIERRVEFLRSRETNPDSADSGNNDHDGFFYPNYMGDMLRTAFHPAYENLLELLCRKINAPIGFVLPLVDQLDKRVRHLIYHFERTEVELDFVRRQRKRFMEARKRPPAPDPTQPVIIDASVEPVKGEDSHEPSRPQSRDPPPLDKNLHEDSAKS